MEIFFFISMSETTSNCKIARKQRKTISNDRFAIICLYPIPCLQYICTRFIKSSVRIFLNKTMKCFNLAHICYLKLIFFVFNYFSVISSQRVPSRIIHSCLWVHILGLEKTEHILQFHTAAKLYIIFSKYLWYLLELSATEKTKHWVPN